jgi:opacity protein-like surface antigen
MKPMLLILAMLFMPVGWVFPQDVPNKAPHSSPGMELDLSGGLGLSGASLMNPSYNDGSPTGGQVGFGGGLGGFFYLDNNFSTGLIAGYYNFSQKNTEYIPNANPTTYGSYGTMNIIECMVAGKYCFDGNRIRPYLLGGVGIAAIESSVTFIVASAGTPASTPTQVSPMFAIGAGLKFPLNKGLNLFIQDKNSVVIVPETTITFSQSPPVTRSISASTQVYSVYDLGVDFEI